MTALTYEVIEPERRNRLTVGFRLILAIPHLIVAHLWSQLAGLLGLIQWFIVLFTGRRNEGIRSLQTAFLRYYGRVLGYIGLLYDEWPSFTDECTGQPVTTLRLEQTANRLTNALRLIWAIPAIIIALALGIAGSVVTLIAWFAILFTGRHPRGMWQFGRDVTHYSLQLQAYTFLATDTYPKFRGATEG